MKNNNSLTRRSFLRAAGAISGTSLARLSGPALAAIAQAACSARNHETPFTVLADDEGEDFAAIAARIIPTTDTPGATEAGVIHFIDLAFADRMSDSLDAARSGLAEFNANVRDGLRFARLDTAEQDALLRSIEDTEFFGLMRTMTITGFFAMGKYGGNKDNVGWELIGFGGHNGGWQYPFGYYDAKVHDVNDDAG
jgi:gluconate 2-dehydrogenase gamma chain